VWHRSQDQIRHIPIIFVDGDPNRIEHLRAALPDAIYTSRIKLLAALKRAKLVANPAAPAYRNRTAAQKLGIEEHMRVAVIDAPRGYAQAIGPLPTGAEFEEEPMEALPVTLWFVRDAESFRAAIPGIRERAAARLRVWVAYPKRQSRTTPEITARFILESSRAAGLATRKSCSLGETWNSLLFALRKA
jgi:hypothetical protein